MNGQTVGWFIFLALIKHYPRAQLIGFKLENSHLTAKEGSCAGLKCTVTNTVDFTGAYWFWMKDAYWIEGCKDFNSTIVYSTNNSLRPVSPDFADRVKYAGSLGAQPQCSILICNLNKTDSGNYSVRFVGQNTIYKTTEVNLTVTENSCPITFEKPPVVKESDPIRLICSTLSSCPLNPQIGNSAQLDTTVTTEKITEITFKASWKDDGRVFSCQIQDNTDAYLIKNISVTVEYAPKNIVATVSPKNITEGQSVTLTCFANGNPHPNYTWFKNDLQVYSGAEWKIHAIKESQSGKYHCEALNKHESMKSNTVLIDVVYKPEVEVKTTHAVVKQGDVTTLTCHVRRSNPQPHTYVWFKNEKVTDRVEPRYVVERIMPEDSGIYKCSATNSVGTGTSEPFDIKVQYGPRKTNISINEKVKVGNSLMLTCDTDADPPPWEYTWFIYYKNKQPVTFPVISHTTDNKILHLEHVQRADELCCTCNASNRISRGKNSQEVCKEVLYPPTNPMLSMDTEVKEGQLITISCTVESSPPSDLSLTRTSPSNPQPTEVHLIQAHANQRKNTLKHTFTVNSTHTYNYTCIAKNSEGSIKSESRKLVVKYHPKDVTVQAQPGLIVIENTTLTLRCTAQSYPEVTAVTWRIMTDGKSQIIGKDLDLHIQSVSLSDRGQYSCEATNDFGTGYSKQVEVKVKYAPKDTKITRVAEQKESDGTISLLLSCSSHSYPPVKEYSWYRRTNADQEDMKVSQNKNYIVYSNQPGDYYCIAKNEINQTLSDPLSLFADRGLMKALKFTSPFLMILLVILALFVYRYKRRKLIQQGSTTPPCFGFLAWRNLMNEPIMAEPFRSRDDLLSDQPCRPNAQRRQPRPDSTPASDITSVYCTVNLPAGKQGPSAQKPIRQQGGCTVEGPVNYSLHFENKQNKKQAKAEENVVYAMVSKQKPPTKQERLEDYENVNAARSPNPLNYDTDTSEDEVELNYSQVSFKAKPGCQIASRDSSSTSSTSSTSSSTSDDEETQYSEVKI